MRRKLRIVLNFKMQPIRTVLSPPWFNGAAADKMYLLILEETSIGYVSILRLYMIEMGAPEGKRGCLFCF